MGWLQKFRFDAEDRYYNCNGHKVTRTNVDRLTDYSDKRIGASEVYSRGHSGAGKHRRLAAAC
jgi:hypothetical protein